MQKIKFFCFCQYLGSNSLYNQIRVMAVMKLINIFENFHFALVNDIFTF